MATGMYILSWVVLGLIAGFVASKIVNKRGEGLVMDVVLGIGGALLGGFILSILHVGGATGLNLYSLAVAIGGAIVILILYHAILRMVRDATPPAGGR